MKDISIIYEECCADLVDYGLSEPPNTPKLTVDKRSKRRWGMSKYTPVPEILISSRLLDDSVNDYGARNCMMHEILHHCTPGDGHTGKWKELAGQVNRKSKGKYNIKRTSSSAEYGVEPVGKYKFECTKCGVVVTRSRASNFTRNPEQYGHKGCTGKFKPVTRTN